MLLEFSWRMSATWLPVSVLKIIILKKEIKNKSESASYYSVSTYEISFTLDVS